MKIMTITGLVVCVDVLGEGDKEEAAAALDAMNVVCSDLDGRPQIMGVGDIDNSQIEVEDEKEDE